MAKNKETAENQINVRLTDAEIRVLQSFGGATAFIKAQLHEKAGDKFKLTQLKHQILDRIDADQKQVKDLDKLILEMEKKAEVEAEEAKKVLTVAKSKKPEAVSRVVLSNEAWVWKWKPYFLQKLNEHGGLHEMEYKSIFDKIGLKTKEEADAWIRGAHGQ